MTERNRERWLLLAAALLCLPGLWLRVCKLEWMEFSGDELMTMVQPYRAAHERFALHGILTSAGIYPPNFLVYLLALPVTLSRDPLDIVAFVVMWNLVGLACLLRALWRIVPPAVALCGVALVASAPGPLLYSRKIWNPDFIPASVMLVVLLVALGMEKPRRALVIGIFVVCTILTGFHVTTVVLVPCILVWAWMLRVPLERRGIWIGCAAAFVLSAPYLWFLVSSRFDDPLGLLAARAGSSVPAASRIGLFGRHAAAALESCCDAGLLQSAGGWSAALVRAFAWFTALASILVLVRVPWLARRVRQGLEVAAFDKLLALGALFELALLVCFAFARVPVVPHYYAVLIPFPTLAALWLGSRFGRVPLLAACALVVAAQTQLFGGFLDRLPASGPPPGVHYAQPFAPRAQEWRAEINRTFDEIDSGHATARAEQERLRARFEASQEVLMHFDTHTNQPPASFQGHLELQPGVDGLEVQGSTAMDMLRLPPFELGGHGRALLRLELWSPKEVAGAVFYANAQHPDYARGLILELHTLAGENVFYMEIPDPTAQGSLMLRHGAYRWTLRAAEVRRVPD